MSGIENFNQIRSLLKTIQSIAVVGLSPKKIRPSNMVARYLVDAGYTVIPVNPGQTTILGLPCYASLTEIPSGVDLVNIFRRSEDVYPLVEAAVQIGAKAVWMQQGIVNDRAAALGVEHGLTVIMDRCIKVDLAQLSP